MTEKPNKQTNDGTTQSIVDMSDEQILDLINKYYSLYKQEILDFANEADFPTEDLINVVSGMTYLIESGLMPNADEVFGDFWKLSWTELQARMGTIPTDDTTPPIYDESVDGNTDPTIVEPDDYTDVATGEYDPTPEDGEPAVAVDDTEENPDSSEN